MLPIPELLSKRTFAHLPGEASPESHIRSLLSHGTTRSANPSQDKLPVASDFNAMALEAISGLHGYGIIKP